MQIDVNFYHFIWHFELVIGSRVTVVVVVFDEKIIFG